MGKRGPPRTPTKMMLIRGTKDVKYRRGPEVEIPDTGEPEAPEYLNGPAFEKWEELAPMLYAVGLLTEQDVDALAKYCALWARWRVCEEALEAEGQWYEKHSPQGGFSIVMHPAATVANQLLTQIRALEDRFGLTPSARAGLKVDKPKSKSKLDKLKEASG